MNDLRRELAPVTTAAWAEIDAEATRTLKTYLAARKLVDFKGPLGWDYSAENLGRSKPLNDAPGGGVEARRRMVQPLVELRAVFDLSRSELDAVSRGAADPDLAPLVEAARNLSLAENALVFQGYAAADIQGMISGSAHGALTAADDFTAFPRVVAEALETLRESGIAGPFAIALGPAAYNDLSKTTGSGGYPVLRHVERLIDGPIVWAPSLEGAVVLSMRGGDFELVVGRDISIGYLEHNSEKVQFYLEESLTFRLLTPEAAVAIRRKS